MAEEIFAHVAGIENQEVSVEKDIRELHRLGIVWIQKSPELFKKVQALKDGAIPEEIKKEVIDFLAEMNDLICGLIDKISNDSQLNLYFEHDVAAPVQVYYSYSVEIILTGLNSGSEFSAEKLKVAMKYLYSVVARSIIGLEATLMRAVSEQKIDLKYIGNINLPLIIEAIKFLVNSSAVEGSIKKHCAGVIINPELEKLVDSNEVVMGNTGVIGNIIQNIISNAARACKARNRSSFHVEIKREGEFLICLVSDTAGGMKHEQLNPDSIEYIFGKGEVSSRAKSTGLGLAYADSLLSSMESEIQVWSKDQSNGSDAVSHLVVAKNGEKKLSSVERIGTPYSSASTTFEICLPIKKVA